MTNRPRLILFIVSSLFLIASIGTLFVAPVRTGVQALFNKQQRVILAKIEVSPPGKDSSYLIFKVLTHDGDGVHLRLEAYDHAASEGETASTSPLIDSIQLSGVNDSHILIKNQATNLAIVDLNGDGDMELVAPTSDGDGVVSLNVIQFLKNNKVFSQIPDFK